MLPERKRRKVVPRLSEVNQAILMLGKKRKFGEAVSEFHSIRQRGMWPNRQSFLNVIQVCCRAGQSQKAVYFLKLLEREEGAAGLAAAWQDDSLLGCLLKGFGLEFKVRPLYEALRLGCPSLTTRLVNQFFRSAVRAGCVHEARRFWRWLEANDCASSDWTTLALLVEMLCLSGRTRPAHRLWRRFARSHPNPSSTSNTTSRTAIASAANPALPDTFAQLKALVFLCSSPDCPHRDQLISRADELQDIVQAAAVDDPHAFPDESRGLFFRHKVDELLSFSALTRTHPVSFQPVPGLPASTTPTLPTWLALQPTHKRTLTDPYTANVRVVELGCGHGDWILHRAQLLHSPGHFLANDIRWDRCALTLLKRNCLFPAEGDNSPLIIVGGESLLALNTVTDNSLHEVAINFPEPPHLRDDPSNFLRSELFAAIHRKLNATGFLSIVSDQVSYMQYLSSCLVKPLTAPKSTSPFRCTTLNGPWLYETCKPPTENQSSYFSRWDHQIKATSYLLLSSDCG